MSRLSSALMVGHHKPKRHKHASLAGSICERTNRRGSGLRRMGRGAAALLLPLHGLQWTKKETQGALNYMSMVVGHSSELMRSFKTSKLAPFRCYQGGLGLTLAVSGEEAGGSPAIRGGNHTQITSWLSEGVV
jgi:hypothetical protein